MDTPSVFVASTYQTGVAAGWYYAFTPDGGAVFSQSIRLDTDRVQVTCRADGQTCEIKADDGETVLMTHPTEEVLPSLTAGVVNGMMVARIYAGWVLAGQRFLPPTPVLPPAAPAPLDPVALLPDPPAAVQAAPQPAAQPDPGPAAQAAPQPTARPDPGPAAQAAPQPTARPDPGPAAQVAPMPVAQVVPRNEVAPIAAPEPAPAVAVSREASAPKKPEAFISMNLFSTPDAPVLPLPAPGQAPVLTGAGPQTPVSDTPSQVDCSLGYGLGLHGKRDAAVLCNYAVTKQLSLHASAFYYLDQSGQKPYDPDFTYVVSYALTPVLTLTYANYSGNYFIWHNKPSSGGKIGDGGVQISYGLPFNNTLFGMEAGSFPDFSVVVGAGTTLLGKPQLQLSLGVMPIPKLSLRATVGYYPIAGQQQPRDGDFSYTASYQISDNWSVQYNNHSGNRWLWHNLPSSGTTVRDGSFLLLYRFLY